MSKYFISSSDKFEKDILRNINRDSHDTWLRLVALATQLDRPSANYTSTIKRCKSYDYFIKPFAPIEDKYKPCHYSGLTRHQGLFLANNKIYYNLSNREPTINTEGFFDFYVHIIFSSEFLEAIKDLPVYTLDPDPSSTLILSPGSEGTMISQPFNIFGHDSIGTFQFHLTDSSKPVIIEATTIRLALLPIVSSYATQGIKALVKENTPHDFSNQIIKIPIMNPDEIIPFYLRINAYRPMIISNISKEIKTIITINMNKLGTTLCDALHNYRPNDTQSKAILDIALTQWLVVPTFILLFPSQKHSNKLQHKIGGLIEERMQLVRTATENGEAYINMPTNHLFNKVRNVNVVPGKIAQAERCILRRKYSTANSILKSFGVFTETGNSRDTFNSLSKLNPTYIVVQEVQTRGMDDLENFARSHPGDTSNDGVQEIPYFTPLNVQKVLLTNTRKNTSAGIDRLSAELIYSLISDAGCDISKELLATLARLFNLLVTSPSYIWRFINISSLHAIPKDDGTPRPIANGTQWRKIFGSIILERFKDDINKHYGLIQFAGKRLAAEQFTSITRLWFNNNKRSFLLKFDIRNAFNTFLRTVSFEELYKAIPQLGLIVSNIFCMPLPLLFQETGTIDAVLGSQQGCVFGQVLFNFAFQRVLKIMQLEFPEAKLISYADDNNTCFTGTFDRLVLFINRFIDECNKIGLSLNNKKSLIIIPQCDHDISEYTSSLLELGFESKNIVKRSDDESIPVGIEVLGCPIGNDAFIIEYLTNYFDDYYELIKASKKLQSLHCRWTLAKNSIFAKLAYIVRLTPPEFTAKFYSKIEDEDWSIIESIVQLNELDHMTPEDIQDIRAKGKLKIPHGGYNLKDYSNLATASFLGGQLSIYNDMVEYFKTYEINGDMWIKDLLLRISSIQAELLSSVPQMNPSSPVRMTTDSDTRTDNMVVIEHFINDVNTRTNNTQPQNPRKYQAFFSNLLYKSKFCLSIPSSMSHAHNWLYLDPSSTKTPVSNNTYKRMFRFDRKVHFVPQGTSRKCICGRSLDSQENHLTGCAHFGIRTRHNNVVNILEDYFRLLKAKPISGEIQICSFQAIRNVQESIDNIRPSAVLNNISNITESPLTNHSCSSFNALVKLTSELSASSYLYPPNLDSSNDHPPHHPSHVLESNSNNINTTNNNTTCPISTNNLLGSGTINNSVSATSIHSSSSTKGTRVDLVTTASWIPLMMDVTIVNNAMQAEHEYLQKFKTAEASKNKLHLDKVKAIGYSYFPPIFSTDGTPSRNTKLKLQEYYNASLRLLNHNDAKAYESHGNLTDYFLNKICFEIHRANAEEANTFNYKLVQNTNSSPLNNQLLHETANRRISDSEFTETLRARYQNKKNGRD